MKIVFFFILLINSIFFFWHYRQGAPHIYLPASSQYTTLNAEKIKLLSGPPAPEIKQDVVKNTETHEKSLVTELVQQSSGFEINFIGPLRIGNTQKSLSVQENKLLSDNDFVGPLNTKSDLTRATQKNINTDNSNSEIYANSKEEGVLNVASTRESTISICFQLKKDIVQQDIITHSTNLSKYQLKFSQQERPYYSNYLVLTLPAESLQQATSLKENLRQQGINDLWLFKKGDFKWQISLGLFSSEEKAELAKSQYTQQITQPLLVMPSIQMQLITHVLVSAENKADISQFKQSFANYIDKQVDCFPTQQ